MKLKTILIFCMLALISSVSGFTSCPSDEEFEESIRSAIVDYFNNPSEENLDVLNDLVEFYSSHDLSTADCSEAGENSGVEIQEIYSGAENVSAVGEGLDEKSVSLTNEIFSWVDDLLHSEWISNSLIGITLHSWGSDNFQFPIGSNNLWSSGGMRFAVRYDGSLKWSHDGWIGSSIQTLPVTETLHFTENTNDKKVAMGKVADNSIEVKTETTLLKDKKWMLIVYTLRNKGGNAVNNVKFYQGADFDVDHVTSSNDYGGYDSNLKLLYEWDSDGYPYVGFASSLNPKEHDVSNYRTIWNRINSDSLAGGNSYGIGDAGIAFSWEFGTLNPGQTKEIPIILATGTNLNDLKTEIQEGLSYVGVPPSLLEKYAPVLYLHPDELFEPKTIDSMLEEAHLKILGLIVDYLPVSVGSLEGRTSFHYLDMINAKPGVIPYIGVPDQPGRFDGYDNNVYGRIIEEAGYTILQYWFFYPYNNWWNNHEGDWELIEVVLDGNENPLYATYSFHWGGKKHLWNDISKIDGTHPKVYVARGSHGNRQAAGNYEVCSYPFIDEASSGGDYLSLNAGYELTQISDTTSWVDFAGRWGEIEPRLQSILGTLGPSSPKLRKMFNAPNAWEQPLEWGNNPNPSFFKGCTNSPVHIHIFDSEGNHVGLNESGDIVAEIENTYLYIPSDEDPELVSILTSEDLFVQIEATNEGEFDFSMSSYDSALDTEISAEYNDIPITKDTIATVDVTSENPTFVMEVDIDGDDVVDYTKIPEEFECEGSGCETPQIFKVSTVVTLNAITTNEHNEKEIDNAIKQIQNSLDSSLWINGSTLDIQFGHKVFSNEKKAIEHLMKVIEETNKFADATINEDVLSAINSLVEMDKSLAQIAIDVAESMPVLDPKKQGKVDLELSTADDELSKAEEKVMSSEFDKAVDHFRKAWEHAQLAMKHTQK